MIINCVQRGQEFEARGQGKAYYCTACRKQQKNRAKAAAELWGFSRKIKGPALAMPWKLKMSYEQKLRARQPNGKLAEYKPCPNYDGSSISCVTCPAEAWKYKNCGRSK